MESNGSRWQPSYWGKRVLKCDHWSLWIDTDQVVIFGDAVPFAIRIADVGDVTLTPGWLWTTVEIAHPERRIRLRGIPNKSARKLASAVRVGNLAAQFDAASSDVEAWVESLSVAAAQQLKAHGWLTHEFTEEWASRKAAIGFDRLLQRPELQDHIASQSRASFTIDMWRYELTDFISQQNEHHLAAQLEANHDFFRTVEKSPLTPEQARAVVCFDNRMLVVASAGSGKTSTMVAKAGYAIHRNLIPADKILMLAFNADAAKELQTRTRERLAPLGLNADKVVAKTFHAFGLEIIGQATGKKPSLAPWLDNGGDLAQLGRIVDVLRKTNPSFRIQWDFFRAVLARDYVDTEAEPDEVAKPATFRTAKGETVKSSAERMIADWLYFNSVEYEYERPYEVDTATAERRQYHPDFYYPQIDAYHEHWALDKNGEAPEEFAGYMDGVVWKRETHRQHGTTLLETTKAELWGGTALDNLAKDLTERGIRLRSDPERLLAGQPPSEYGRLLQTFRSFLTHAKTNRLSDDDLRNGLEEQAHGEVRYRDEAFLRLFMPIRREWDRILAADGYIDFDDMLNLSTDHLEAGDWDSPYELVMVDEFQDASNARARMAKALVDQPGRHLFAVGDDWQSINRFAGADVSVMTGYADMFGPSEVLRLERTFRFPQSIADVSSRFVLQNPSQLAKTVVSSTAEFPPTIGVVSVDAESAVKAAIRHRLKVLHDSVASGAIPAPADRKLTVYVLGRYQHQRDYVPDTRDLAHVMDVKFMTMHSSKGAEADYIVIPGMVRGKWGFPSTIPNDPVLRLAMPAAEDFPRAEERRLFYVAMTRAKRGVLLVTIANRESPFVMELIRDHGIARTNAIGEVLDSVVCPECGRAFMVARTSKRGAFLGCRRYPRCKGTQGVD
jgi:DNA helicase IV